ncbi:hypothetical protein [uncultured Anaerococcus sp.]
MANTFAILASSLSGLFTIKKRKK